MDRDHQERSPNRPHGEHYTTFRRDGVPQPQDRAGDGPRPIYRRMLQLGRPSPYTLPVKVIQRVPVPPQNRTAPVPAPPQGPEPVPAAPPQEILLCEDISGNLESKPIPVYGPQGLDLPDFQYQPTIVGERGSKCAADNYLACSCKSCCEACEAGEACDCLLYSTLPYSKIDGEYRLLYCRDAIFECSDFCMCEDTCAMRTSRRFRGDLQLFYTGAAKGWGVRSSTPIPAGVPVCEFTGILREIEKEVDDEGTNHYTMDIHCLPAILDGQTFVPRTKFMFHKRKGDTAPEIEYTVDPRRRGNIGRFFNHSCDPNLFSQCIVHRAEDLRLSAKQAHIVIFTSKDIPAMEEFTLDYNASGPDQKPCLCNAVNCKKFINF